MVVHKLRRRLLVSVAVAVIASPVAACSPGSSQGPASTNPSVVSTDISGQGNVKLKMLDFWPSGAENDWMNKVVKEFQTAHPNVTITRTSQNWGEVNSTLNLRLADSGGPDIATANQGWQALGTYAKGHLVLNLDAYASAYKWADKVPRSLLKQQQFSADGKQMGTGSLYATPVASSSIVGVNFNKKILGDLGIAVPTTLAEFEAACTKIKAAGQVPINFGSLEPGSATAMLFAVQAMYGAKDKISGFVYGDTGIQASDTGLVEAAQKVKQWADAGWLTPNYAGIAYQDTVDSFKKGKGAFQFNYSGTLSPTGDEQQNFGFALLKQVSGGAPVGVGASRAAIVISAKSAHPDVAAAFLDFLVSQQTAQAAVDNNLTPAFYPQLTMPAGQPEFTEESKAVQTLDGSDGYVPYFDWSTPTLLDTIGRQLQTMLAGKTTPQDMVAAAQADRVKFATGQK
ncbi:ABC transporter substrate-binding protein [Dactylosporangium sp. CA-233914]|uniref:ABC transporter substrate-binding protein n=1 Tax=Dactylosporangium sp. CA-233914 TaxID=3239934 RepID=UPI003D8CCF44